MHCDMCSLIMFLIDSLSNDSNKGSVGVAIGFNEIFKRNFVEPGVAALTCRARG